MSALGLLAKIEATLAADRARSVASAAMPMARSTVEQTRLAELEAATAACKAWLAALAAELTTELTLLATLIAALTSLLSVYPDA